MAEEKEGDQEIHGLKEFYLPSQMNLQKGDWEDKSRQTRHLKATKFAV
jgi:hypothetical protein